MHNISMRYKTKDRNTTELETWNVNHSAKPWGPLPLYLTAAQVNPSSEFSLILCY